MSASLEKITTENTEGTEKTALDYRNLAEIQINGALDMFEQKNYVCALSLSNSARNLLRGLMLDQNERFSAGFVSAFDELKTKKELHGKSEKEFEAEVLLPGNGMKHYKEDFCEREINIKDAASTEICLAGTDLVKVTDKLFPRFQLFCEQISSVISVPSVVNDTAQAPKDINQISGEIIDCAIQVHKLLGPGLLESAYQQALAHVLAARNIPFSKEKPIPITLDGLNIEAGYRADFIINDKIILEIKSVDKLAPIHEAQLLTYMKLGKFPLGILLNFNEKLLKDGIKRMRL